VTSHRRVRLRRELVLVAVAASVVLAPVVSACSGDETTSDSAPPDGNNTTVTIVSDTGAAAIEGDDERGSFFFETEKGDGKLSFDLNGDGVIAEGEGGSFELTPGLPDGWPEDFPRPETAEVIGGNVIDAGSVSQLTGLFELQQSPSEVLAFYEQALAGPGTWKEVRSGDDLTFDASVSFDGQFVGFLIIRASATGTQVAVQLATEG
jgi:hypothetical protein